MSVQPIRAASRGHQRDVIGQEARNIAVKIVRGRQAALGDQVEEFCAPKDFSFDVKRSEVLGRIARSEVILKILSRASPNRP
jgi:hypothetical protein